MPRPVTAKELLANLRAEACQEYGIVGVQAIGLWFYQMGYSARPPSRRTLMRWKAEKQCPLVCPRWNQKLWTTNLLLMSWAASRVKKQTMKKRDRTTIVDVAGREMVAEAIRKKLLASAPSRADQGTPPTESPSS